MVFLLRFCFAYFEPVVMRVPGGLGPRGWDGKGSVLEVMSTPRLSAEVVMSLGMILGGMAGPCSGHRLALGGQVGSGLCAVMLVRMLVRMP